MGPCGPWPVPPPHSNIDSFDLHDSLAPTTRTLPLGPTQARTLVAAVWALASSAVPKTITTPAQSTFFEIRIRTLLRAFLTVYEREDSITANLPRCNKD